MQMKAEKVILMSGPAREVSPRLGGKVSIVDMFPGFNVEAFVQGCVSKGITLGEAKRAIRGETSNDSHS